MGGTQPTIPTLLNEKELAEKTEIAAHFRKFADNLDKVTSSEGLSEVIAEMDSFMNRQPEVETVPTGKEGEE